MDVTHIVVKKEDALKYLTEPELQSLEQILNTIARGRTEDGKLINKYYICNTDEPYAEIVHGVISEGEVGVPDEESEAVADSDVATEITEEKEERYALVVACLILIIICVAFAVFCL